MRRAQRGQNEREVAGVWRPVAGKQHNTKAPVAVASLFALQALQPPPKAHNFVWPKVEVISSCECRQEPRRELQSAEGTALLAGRESNEGDGRHSIQTKAQEEQLLRNARQQLLAHERGTAHCAQRNCVVRNWRRDSTK